jgi:hypothetical protein
MVIKKGRRKMGKRHHTRWRRRGGGWRLVEHAIGIWPDEQHEDSYTHD